MPEQYIGLWRRSLLIDAAAREDRTSQVFWLQTGRLFADIRIPAERGKLSMPRGEAIAKTLPSLALQEGFAGELEVQGDALTWHRWFDYQPATGTADTGRVHFHRGRLIEEGVHAAYIEHWEPVTGVDAGHLALQLTEERTASGDQAQRRGVWVISGDYFIYALGRVHEFHRNYDLGLAVAHSRHRGLLQQQLLECEIHFGRRNGRRPWEILLSTLPWYEGGSLLTGAGAGHWTGNHLEQRIPASGGCRRWQLVEAQGIAVESGIFSRS